MRLTSTHVGIIALIVITLIAVPLSIKEYQDKRQLEQAQETAQRRTQYEAATQTVYVRSWDQYIECGILRHDLRVCDRRYWPGQVYPDEPIPGEKTPGIVWHCENEQLDRRYPPHKVCYGDVSNERKKAYPCPTDAAASRLSSDRFCARAKGLPADS